LRRAKKKRKRHNGKKKTGGGGVLRRDAHHSKRKNRGELRERNTREGEKQEGSSKTLKSIILPCMKETSAEGRKNWLPNVGGQGKNSHKMGRWWGKRDNTGIWFQEGTKTTKYKGPPVGRYLGKHKETHRKKQQKNKSTRKSTNISPGRGEIRPKKGLSVSKGEND